MDAPDEMHYRDCGSIGGGWPHPASAHAPDEMVEAVAEGLFRHWYGAEWGDVQANPIADQYRAQARAVLSVPVLAEVIARDAKVREIVDEPWGDDLTLSQAGRLALSAVERIAALYPEAGKPDDSDIMPGSEFDGPVVL